jgi:hypothetical protein
VAGAVSMSFAGDPPKLCRGSAHALPTIRQGSAGDPLSVNAIIPCALSMWPRDPRILADIGT